MKLGGAVTIDEERRLGRQPHRKESINRQVLVSQVKNCCGGMEQFRQVMEKGLGQFGKLPGLEGLFRQVQQMVGLFRRYYSVQ